MKTFTNSFVNLYGNQIGKNLPKENYNQAINFVAKRETKKFLLKKL